MQRYHKTRHLHRKEEITPKDAGRVYRCWGVTVYSSWIFSPLFCLFFTHLSPEIQLFLPSAWRFSLVGTAAVPPVFLAAWWHPSQTAPTLTDKNSHGSQKVEQQPSREWGKKQIWRLETLINSSVATKLSLTHLFPVVLFKYAPFVPPTFSLLIPFLFFFPALFLSFLCPTAVRLSLSRQVRRNSHWEGGKRREGVKERWQFEGGNKGGMEEAKV